MWRGRASAVAAVMVGVVLSALLAPSPASSGEPPGSPGGIGSDRETTDVLGAALPVPLGSQLRSRLDEPDRPVDVIIELTGDPVAVRRARAAASGTALSPQSLDVAEAELRTAQEPVADAVARLGGTVSTHLLHAYNGVTVRVPAAALTEIASLPSVQAVHPVPFFEPLIGQSLPTIGAPDAWERFDLDGDGVDIAIIDSGIDYTHATFGGTGDPAHFEANDPDVVEPGSFPTYKVVGGWDFAGDEYDPTSEDLENAIPQPDPDPLDCGGHGTHVAGIAAGFGVTADGSTYRGPYDSSTLSDPARFAIAPGVAPGARLYALKVFGCDGPTGLAIDALDWAVARQVDVVNLSLGTDYGLPLDPFVAAINNATLAGTSVVMAAGNAGPADYVVASPSVATGGISVAAVDTVPTLPAASFVVEGRPPIQMLNANQAPIPEPITAPVVVLRDDPATPRDESLGCAPEDYADADDAIVVTLRGVCPRTERAVLGQAAGALAVVMINTDEALPPVEGPIDGVTIPFLGVGAGQGDNVRSTHGETATITDAGTIPNPRFRRAAPFTSPGPAGASHAAKPDVAAPGVSIVSAAVGTGNGPLTASGTSMASPFVTGIAALVKQAHPDWDATWRNAAIVGTGNPGAVVEPSSRFVGSGLADAARAVSTPVIAVGGPLSATTSFGLLEGSDALTLTREVVVHNRGSAPASFEAMVHPDRDIDAVTVRVEPAAIDVPAGGSTTVRLTIDADATGVDTGFQPIGGTLHLHPTAGPPGVTDVRVPYQGVLRPTSLLTTTPDHLHLNGASFVTFTTRNASPITGAVDVYAWGLADAAGDAARADLRAVGVHASPDDDTAAFALNTHTPINPPSAYQWEVVLDTDGDDEFEFAVIGVDTLLLGGAAGTVASVVLDLDRGEIVAAYVARAELNTSTVVLPFRLSDVGLSADGDTDFAYTAGLFALAELGFDIAEGIATFDVGQPQLETGQSFDVGGHATVPWVARYDLTRPGAHTPLGWMLVYDRNPLGAPSAQLIEATPVTPPPASPASATRR